MKISNALTMYYNPVNDEYSFTRESGSDIRFDSLLEKTVFDSLKKVIALSQIITKPTLTLVGKNTNDPVTWSPDFLVNRKIIVEAKGYITSDFAVKARIFKHVYPNLALIIVGNEHHLKRHLPRSLDENIIDLRELQDTLLNLIKDQINDSKNGKDSTD